jgi:hypothetical protein
MNYPERMVKVKPLAEAVTYDRIVTYNGFPFVIHYISMAVKIYFPRKPVSYATYRHNSLLAR